MKILKIVVIVLVVLFAAIQFIRPSKTNPGIDESRTLNALLQPSPEVSDILERSCKDCHSYKTVWPWYSQIAPVSWLLVDDVNEGRNHLNFSDWASYDTKRSLRKLGQICEEVEKGDMPLWFYVPLHPNSKLSDQDKKTLCDWTKKAQQTPSSEVTK